MHSLDIHELVIVSAPAAAGKSTFLNHPGQFLSRENTPVELAALHDEGPKHLSIMTWGTERTQHFERIHLHVDLSQPLHKLNPRPNSRQELLAAITPELFRTWPELQSCLKRTERVRVVTLFVNRTEHRRRWAMRFETENPYPDLGNPAFRLVADELGKSELHRSYYRAWCDYVDSAGVLSHHCLNGSDHSSNGYFWMEPDALSALLQHGYE